MACLFPRNKRSLHRLPRETKREGLCRQMPPWTCWAHFKFIKSVSYSLQRWIQVQVNVSIRYLSFARKTFSIGLFLLNTMTRSVHREIKEMCLPLLLLVICAIYSRMWLCISFVWQVWISWGALKYLLKYLRNKLSSYTINWIKNYVKFTKSTLRDF